ncbi:MAG TPA: hypothetical protein VHX12_10910, partial [Acidisoma sp.]|nr:hypothetical protein [Acidisoma sp.]
PEPASPALPPGEVGEAPLLLVPGTVPVTGLVGADVAGESTGDVTAGSFAVVPMSLHAARPKSTPAAGTRSDSFLIFMVSPSIIVAQKYEVRFLALRSTLVVATIA